MQARVFIGSSAAAMQIAEHAQAELTNVSLPEIWSDGRFLPQKTPIENLFVALDQFDFALFVAIPEDLTSMRGKDHWTMRDNVLFEAGLFLGRLGRERVFIIAPNNTTSVSLSLPSDLTGVQPTNYNPAAANIQASVGTALYHMKNALRQFSAPSQRVIFDSRVMLQPYQLVPKAGQKWDKTGKPVSEFALGDAKLTDDHFELARKNADGIFEVEIRPRGESEPSIPRVPNTDRIFDVRFEARVESTPHTVRIVILNNRDFKWIANQPFAVSNTDWLEYAAPLMAPSNVDLLVRIDEEVQSAPSGKLFLRNIVIRQYEA